MSEELYRHAGDIDDELSYYVRAEDAERKVRLAEAVLAAKALDSPGTYANDALRTRALYEEGATRLDGNSWQDIAMAWQELAAALRALEADGEG